MSADSADENLKKTLNLRSFELTTERRAPARKPFLGKLAEVKYEGNVYTVETEDTGPRRAMVVTQLYRGGAVIASKERSYEGDRGRGDFVEHVKMMMEIQHQEMLGELNRGEHTDAPVVVNDSTTSIPIPTGELSIKDPTSD